jgi:hypothetical protein
LPPVKVKGPIQARISYNEVADYKATEVAEWVK